VRLFYDDFGIFHFAHKCHFEFFALFRVKDKVEIARLTACKIGGMRLAGDNHTSLITRGKLTRASIMDGCKTGYFLGVLFSYIRWIHNDQCIRSDS